MRTIPAVVVGVGLLLGAEPVLAHHSFAAEYDADKQVTFQNATITKMEWMNPHSWITIDVKKPDGATEQWQVEVNTPNALARRGISRDVLKPGTVITISGYLAKDGGMRMTGRDIIYPDGRKFYIGSTGTGAPGEEGQKDQK